MSLPAEWILRDPGTVTRKSKSNFFYSFLFLPREKRKAIYTVYSFCRQTDDIADAEELPLEKKIALLNWWEQELKQAFTRRVSNYFSQLRQVADRFRIPLDLFLELIDGVRMDLEPRRYKTFDDLLVYCQKVASVVGLMSIRIFGYRDDATQEYARNLGIALQLTNILRDVKKDIRMGRLYLPLEDLQRFGVTEAAIRRDHYSTAFRELMAFEAQRAHAYYQKAERCLPPSDRSNMVVAEIMKAIYFQLLLRLEAIEFDVFHHLVRIPTGEKVRLALQTFLHNRFSARTETLVPFSSNRREKRQTLPNIGPMGRKPHSP